MKKISLFTVMAAVAIAATVGMNGVAKEGIPEPKTKEKGVVTPSVNPEIQVEYSQDGKVTDIRGINDSGKQIEIKYQDYIGKDCSTVLDELIGLIYEAGYFVDDVDGGVRSIILELEPGVVLSKDDYLRRLKEDVKEAVEELNIQSYSEPHDKGVTDYGVTDYGATDYGVTDYGVTDYGVTDYGVTDYGVTDYGVTDYGVTDYNDTDYNGTDYGR